MQFARISMSKSKCLEMPNKALQLSLMDTARFLLSQCARRVKCATEFGCYVSRDDRG